MSESRIEFAEHELPLFVRLSDVHLPNQTQGLGSEDDATNSERFFRHGVHRAGACGKFQFFQVNYPSKLK